MVDHFCLKGGGRPCDHATFTSCHPGGILQSDAPRDITSKARALAPHAHAHHIRLAILSAPDALVALRSPTHYHLDADAEGGGGRSCGRGRLREKIGESAVLARSGCAHSIGTTPLHPPIALVMLSRASIPSQVALDAGAGRRFPGAGSAPAAKSATAPPLHPTDVPRASAQCFYTHIHPRSCSVTPRTRDRHFRPRRPRVKGPAVTFSFETGDANRRNQLCCTV